MDISVIVPTYNRPQALRLCLLSLAGQSTMPSEVLIADDGSGPDTRATVREMQESLRDCFPIQHVWQEDRGFRKPKILNETVRQSSGDYLIFIDGDCMAHRDFVKAHRENSHPDRILSGKRVEIGRKLTERVLKESTLLNSLTLRLIWDAVRGDSRKVEEAIPITNGILRRLLHRDRITPDGVWGCNFSLYKNLFEAINGCDEDFVDGSIEDNDIGIRVLNQGKQLHTVRSLAIIFHLWHGTTWAFKNDKYKSNLAILKRRMLQKETFCRNGIKKL
jgi:glycosyltransferase involved in cell wall biosynthesis